MPWFRVEISDEHGQIVAIETESIAGRDIGPAEDATIRKAIAHLQGFVGNTSEQEIDEEMEVDEYAYQMERESQMLPCGCKFCICFQGTEFGEPCADCSNHVHQW